MWTENEKDIVRRIYPVGGPTECKKMLPKKSIEQIKRFAHYAGIKLAFGHRSQWRPEEDAILREHYIASGAEFCHAILPGRTVKMVDEGQTWGDIGRPISSVFRIGGIV